MPGGGAGRFPSFKPASDPTLVSAHAPRPRPAPPATTSSRARSNNSLTSTLDPGLGQGWPLMEDLELSVNKLRGPLPASFAAMGRLKVLYLK